MKTHSKALTQTSALALATGMVLSAAPASAQLIDGSFQAQGVVVEGQAQISREPSVTEIVIETEGVVIDWIPDDVQGSGDISFQPFGTIATFRDDGIVTDFAVLNRILPTDLSRRVVFNGTVVSEIQGQVGGTVFFYSPGGILVGLGAVFDVGNLGLTTAEPITDGFGNFILGDTVDFAPSLPGSSITIDQDAQIFADQNPGSYVALFAPRIVNRGSIFVDGQAALVGAESGTITFSPDGLFDIQVDIGSEFATPIENTGIIGGAPSVDGSSRVYMVAISKNAAATIAIRGNSELGFDVANSAFLDGDTVVLSAGFNVFAGEIEGVEASDGFLNILTEDAGLGTGVSFTSSVVGRAASDVTLVAGDVLEFLGNATFSGRQTIATVDFDNGSGTTGNLLAGGDLSLIADRSRDGLDVGVSEFRVFDGSANIIGGLQVETIGAGDGDGNGQVSAGNASVLVDGAGSALNVGADLVVGSRVDLTGSLEGLEANSGFTQLAVASNATVDVAGVTRVRSNSVAGSGGDASSNAAALIVTNGGQLSTEELNVTSRAIAGEDAGFGGRNAISSGASISVEGAGSSLDVQFGNFTGDGAQGELDFLSSEAIASDGLTGDGGVASSGNIDFLVRNGGVVNLADSRAGSLSIVNRAIGGDTFADDARGGNAGSGMSQITITDGLQNLGHMSLLSEAIGGSALPGAERTGGGNGSAGSVVIDILNTTATLEIDEIRQVGVGGDGSTIGSSFAGSGSTDGINFNVSSAQLDILSDLNIVSQGIGGTSQEIGGFGATGALFFSAISATVNISGDLLLNLEGIGGESLGDQVFDPQFAFSEQGGGASTGTINLSGNSSEIAVAGVIDLATRATGGDALVNRGGAANSGAISLRMFHDAGLPGPSLNLLTASDIRLSTEAIGGSIRTDVNPDSFGQGGNSTSGDALVAFDGGENLIDSSVEFTTRARGGDAGAVSGQGGESTAFMNGIDAFAPGASTISGNITAFAESIGGDATSGFGGNSFGSGSQIQSSGGDVIVGGDVSFNAQSKGGDGQTAGSADGIIQRINVNGSSVQVQGTTAFTANTTGGNATLGQGGQASDANGITELVANNGGTVDLIGDVTIDKNVQGGSSVDFFGGGASGGIINLSALNGGVLTMGANFSVNAITIGGSGVTGGAAFGIPTSLGVFNGMAQIDGSANFLNNTTGGASTVGPGGQANGGNVQVSISDNGTANLGGDVTLSSTAVGGSSSDGDGGFAGAGFVDISSNQSNLSIGGNAILTGTAEGGSGVNGGNVNGNSVSLSAVQSQNFLIGGNTSLTNTATGGDASTGLGGAAQFGGANVNIFSSTAEFLGDVSAQSIAQGGDGSVGGEAASTSLNTSLSASTVNIAGNLDLNAQSFGGTGLGVGGAGGAATTQSFDLNLENTTLTAGGDVLLGASAVGGNAQDGDGGSATTSRRNLNISGGSSLNSANLVFDDNAVGGDALGMGSHSGGDATAGGAALGYSIDGVTNIATVFSDVFFATNATGGSGAAGGGNGGAANTGNAEISNFQTGTLDIEGNVIVDFVANGGDAPQGLGGSANLGSVSITTFGGGSLRFEGGVDVTSTGNGGDGQDGGDATGGFKQVFARGILEIGGAFTSNEILTGGNALADVMPGTGGDANAGQIFIRGSNEASISTSLLSVGGLEFNSTITGGNGGNGINGADGGTGGNASGLGGTILGQAINGILEVDGATSITSNVTGGDGGDGVNGGDGGRANFGFLQIGTSSGGSVPGAIGGSATFTTLNVTSNHVGGIGGTASNGTGGDGGEAVGSRATILSRGAPIIADSVSFTLNGTGGAGGAGTTQGNGGDGVGGSGALLLTEAFESTLNGSTNIGAMVINSTGQGGTGAIAGANEFSPFSRIEIEQTDVILGSFTANIVGDSTPDYLVDDGMGGQTPVVPQPFLITLRDGASLNFGTIDITTQGEVGLLASGSDASGNILDITAGSFVPSGDDINDPAFTPGTIDAASLALTATNGDILVEANLATPDDLILNSLGSITTFDLTASSLFLTLGAGGLLDTGLLSTPGGLISVEAVDSLTAPGAVDASSLVLRSLTGDVNFDSPLSLTGDLTADAAGSINTGTLTAENVTLNAEAGDIVASDTITANNTIALTSGGGISVGELNGDTVTARAQSGGFSSGDLLGGSFDIEALGTINVAMVDADSIIARSLEGAINLSERIEANSTVEFDAVQGSINLNSITASSVTASAGSDLVIDGNVASSGAVDLVAVGGDLVVGDVNASGINLRSLDNNVMVQGGLTSFGFVVVDAAGSVFLDSAFVGDLNVAAGGDITASSDLSADANIGLDAGGSLMVNNVSAGSIFGRASNGSITAIDLSAPNGSVNLEAMGAIDFVNIDALLLVLKSLNGSITATGAIGAEEDADVEAEGDVNIGMATAGTLGLRSLTGSVSASGALNVDNAANIAGADSVSLAEVTAGSLDVVASSGDVAVNGTATVMGSASFSSGSGIVTLGDVAAGSINVNAGDNSQSLAPGTRTTAQASAFTGQTGTITTGSLSATGGNVGLNATGSINFGDVDADSVNIVSASGDITAGGAVNSAAAASFTTDGAITLGDVTANAILAQAGGTATIGGTWTTPNVTINAANIDFGTAGAVDTGTNGSVALGSAAGEDVLVGGPGDPAFAGLVLSQDLLERFGGSSLAITGGIDSNIRIEDLDVTSFAGLSDLSFNTGDTIDLVGSLISSVDVSLQALDVRVNLDTAAIDLGTDGTTLTINAGVFVAGDSSVLANGNSGLSDEEIQTLINTPAATPRPDGVITAGSLVLNVDEVAVIQNVGTEDVPAGFIIGSAEGLVINGNDETGTLVVLNGQIAGTNGTNTTGDDAATAIFDAAENINGVGTGSQINGCLFAGCTVVSEDTGEVTSTVSAAVSGATSASTSSTSGTDTGAAGGTSDAGTTESSGDSSNDSSESSEDAGASETPGGAAAGGTGSTTGVDVTVDGVDDGGGGPGEFDIETSDSNSGSSSDAGADAGSDSGSDSGSDAGTDAGSDESGAEEGGSSESDSSSDEGETSEDSEASDDGESEGESEAEEGEDSEESEETEDESEEEESEEEEEESSEEEEEESEGPATGPIAAPPSLINTNTLEQRGTINDPISGSGNPALLDPDVTIAPPVDSGGQ